MDSKEIAGIPEGSCRPAIRKGQEVAVFNIGGQLYATQSNCTHRGGPLCEGTLAGDIVTCPWHGSQFNVRTGEVIDGPAEEPITTYKVEVREGKVFIG